MKLSYVFAALIAVASLSISPALRAAPGDLKWAFATGGALRSSPALGTNGLVYFGSADSNLYAVDAATGTKRWAFQTFGPVLSSPVVAPDGTVLVGSTGYQMYAIDGATGAKRWSKPSGEIYSSPALGENGVIYFTTWGGELNAWSSATGQAIWQWSPEFSVEGAYASPTIGAGGMIFCAISGGAWNDRGFFALDGATGQVRWSFDLVNAVQSSPAIGADGTVYVASFDKLVYALDPLTGKKKWSRLTGDGMSSSPSIGPDGTLYVGSNDGRLYALDSADGSERWTFTSSDTIHSSPAVAADGTVYFGSYDRNVYALDGRTGNEKWRFTTGNLVLSSPVISADGTVFIGSHDGKLYALEGSAGPAQSAWPAFKGGGRRTGSAERDGPPMTQRAPESVIAAEGSATHLDAVIQGSRPMTFQWLFNGSPIGWPGNNSRLEFASVRLSQTGEYTLIASNALGNVRTSARLDVGFVLSLQANPGGQISAEPKQDVYLPGTVVQLTATTASNRMFLRWAGDAIESTNPLRVTMNMHKQFAAKFTAAPGDVLWEFPFQYNGVVSMRVAIDEANTVYLAEPMRLLALDGETGLVKWQFAATNPIVTAPVVASDGTVVFGVLPDLLYAVDGRSGMQKWTTATAGPISQDTASPAVGEDGMIYLISGEKRTIVTAHALSDGTQKWRSNLIGPAALGVPPALGTNGCLYIASSSSFSAVAIAIETATGKPRWTKWVMNSAPAQLVLGGDDTIYLNGNDRMLYAVDGGTGTTRWTASVRNASFTPIVGRDNSVYTLDSNGYLLALNQSGQSLGTFNQGQHLALRPHWAAPLALADDGTLYAVSGDKLLAFNSGSGALNWSAALPSPAVPPPVIGPDGTVYVIHSANDVRLKAIKGTAPPAETPWPMAGSNARNTSSLSSTPRVRVLGIAASPSGPRLTIPTQPGRVHHVEFKDDLGEREWKSAATLAGDGSLQTFQESSGSSVRQRFYRVRIE